MYFVILSKANTYCGIVPSSVYAKLREINEYKTVDETFNCRVVKTNECNSTKLKQIIDKINRGE